MHGFLLWPSFSIPGEGGSPAPLQVALRPIPVAAQLPRPLASAPTDTRTTHPMSTPLDTPVPAIAHAAMATIEFNRIPHPDSTGEPAQGSASATTRGDSGLEAAPATLAGPSPAGEGMDVEGMRQYRLVLAREARHHKRYPPEAMARGLGGTVEVRVAVAGGGVPQAVQLARSSGNGQLDEAALDMMRKAAFLALVPEPLRGRPFAVSLPVVFEAAGD